MSDTSAIPNAAPPAVRSKRYRATLLLFAAVTAALVVWFQRHIEPYVTETLIVGGTISLWGLWKLAWTQFEDVGGDTSKDLTRKFLDSKAAFRALLFAAIIVCILHVFTASIYLRSGGAKPGEEVFKVQILEDNGKQDGITVFMGPFDIKPGTTVGRPIFPSLHMRKLTYEIISPRGFLPEPATLAPWSAHTYSVPGDFKRKELHLLSFYPGVALYSELPKQGETSGDRFDIKIRARGKSTALVDYWRGIVVTGVTTPDLPSASAIASDTTVRQELIDHFAHADINNPEAIVGALMEAPLQRVASEEMAAGDAIEVEIGNTRTGDSQQTRQIVTTCRFQVPALRERHTFVVGPGERGCQ